MDEPTGNQDSKNSDDVMGLFRALNKTGQTIVMATHNPDNCAYAGRIIVLRDGKVFGEPDEPHTVSQRRAAGGV